MGEIKIPNVEVHILAIDYFTKMEVICSKLNT